MTREEISVLSSARREAVRKQLEEIERYKSNPFLYILNPRVTVSIHIVGKARKSTHSLGSWEDWEFLGKNWAQNDL
jgi:hypothetical protein